MQVRLVKRLSSAVLALTIAFAGAVPATTALAAEEEVVGVSLIGYTKAQEVRLYSDDDPIQLTLLADINGSTSEKDVTDAATWTSSSPAVVKVEKGKLTVLKEGNDVTIQGTYKGYTTYIFVDVVNMYNFLDLSASGSSDIDLGADNIQLSATLNKIGGVTEDVTESAAWTTSNSNVATVNKGEVKFIGEGTAKITAKYKTVSDSVEYKVKSPYSKIEIVGGTSPVEMQIGQTPYALRAEATLLNETSTVDATSDAVWKSTNESVVKVDKGVLTPVGRGTAKVTVQYLGKSAEISVLVRLPYLALEVTPGNQEVVYFMYDSDMSQPRQFNAYMMNDPEHKYNVTSFAAWTSSDTLVASVTAGTIIPKSYGTSKITVSHLGLSKEIQVIVYKPLTDITLEKNAVTMFKKESMALPKAMGKLIDGDTVDLTSKMNWTSSDDSIVKVDGGKLVAGNPGSAKLTGILSGRTLQVDIKVQEKVLALISNVNTYSLIVGGAGSNLPAVKAVFEDGTYIENAAKDMQWKTSSPNVLIKDDKITGLAAGRVTLTGTYLNKTISIPVVMEDEIVKYTIEPTDIELNYNRTKSIKVIGTYENGKTTTLSSKLTWISSDETIATVKGATVKGLKQGSVTLTSKYQDQELKVTVHVVPKLTKLQADESRYTLRVGQSEKIGLTAFYENETSDNPNTDAKWVSTKPTYVSVDSSGNMTALKKGTAYIKATYRGRTITIPVTVK